MSNPIDPQWKRHFAGRTVGMKASAIRELLAITAQPDVISFAGGLPANEALPVEEVAVATENVLRKYGPAALQYGETEGFAPLREQIAEGYRERGMHVNAANILLISGSQQGLDMLGRVLIDERDTILVECPTYVGALQAWQSIAPTYASLATDEDGVIVSEMATQPPFKLAYVIPNFQNPSGRTLSAERREQLVDAIHARSALIIEDDPYGELRYSGQPIPSLVEIEARRFGADWNAKGRVIYLGTFSKTLAPGLRVGWVLAPEPLIRMLTMAKQGIDLHTSTLTQMIVLELLNDHTLEHNLPRLRDLYRLRRDTMLSALDQDFGALATWTHPDGGLFLWMRLMGDLDTAQLLVQALTHKVAYVPGAAFYVNPDVNNGGKNELRLNFSSMPPARIQEGIYRLAALVAEQAHVNTP